MALAPVCLTFLYYIDHADRNVRRLSVYHKHASYLYGRKSSKAVPPIANDLWIHCSNAFFQNPYLCLSDEKRLCNKKSPPSQYLRAFSVYLHHEDSRLMPNLMGRITAAVDAAKTQANEITSQIIWEDKRGRSFMPALATR